MATIHRELPLGMKLREVLAWIGSVALADGRSDVADRCRALVGDVGDTEIDAHVPMLHLLCQACGHLRDRGEVEASARVDEIVQLLKRDAGARVVLGSIAFHAGSLAEVEAQAERIVQLAAARG